MPQGVPLSIPVANFVPRKADPPERLISRKDRSSGLDNSIYSDIISGDAVEAILGKMRRNPRDVRFKELLRVCDHYFGPPRHRGGSHRIYKTPWPGDPRINIQNDKGRAKAYQAKQVLAAIKKLEAENESGD